MSHSVDTYSSAAHGCSGLVAMRIKTAVSIALTLVAGFFVFLLVRFYQSANVMFGALRGLQEGVGKLHHPSE
jgi:hypothetical protein